MNKNSKTELILKLLFILVSIFSMSSLLYQKVDFFYKVITILNLINLILIFALKIRSNYWDKYFIYLLSFLLFTNIISTIVNGETNFIDNCIHIAFMTVYCFMMGIYSPKTQQKLFKLITYVVQIVALLSAIFTMLILIFRFSFVLSFKSTLSYYGVMNNRIWGAINPNISAIFCYISIITALLYLYKYRGDYKINKLLKINIIIQFIHFSLQQSRGAILSMLVMIILYSIFISNDKRIKIIFAKLCIYSIGFIISVLAINYTASLYINTFNVKKVYVNKDSKPFIANKTKELESKNTDPNLGIRLGDSTSSGRIDIWKKAIEMAKQKPIFGYGINNIQLYYPMYFSENVIYNSLKGGSFHNIFLTVLVVGGVINLISFTALIGYISYRFLKYLIYGKSKYIKLLNILFFGMMFGELFESLILYSTNFISIFFWTIAGYGLFLINKETYDEKKFSENLNKLFERII